MKRDKRISKWEDRENDFYRALKKGLTLATLKSQNSLEIVVSEASNNLERQYPILRISYFLAILKLWFSAFWSTSFLIFWRSDFLIFWSTYWISDFLFKGLFFWISEALIFWFLRLWFSGFLRFWFSGCWKN